MATFNVDVYINKQVTRPFVMGDEFACIVRWMAPFDSPDMGLAAEDAYLFGNNGDWPPHVRPPQSGDVIRVSHRRGTVLWFAVHDFHCPMLSVEDTEAMNLQLKKYPNRYPYVRMV
jgi:hypothetical protein